MLATLALAALVAPQAPATPAKAVPMAVEVRAAANGPAPVQAWAKELRAALDQRKDEFRRAKPGESAELVVRIDSVVPGPDGAQAMNGALVRGKNARPFNLTYPGEVAPQAEKLARNLRKLADQMKAAPAAR